MYLQLLELPEWAIFWKTFRNLVNLWRVFLTTIILPHKSLGILMQAAIVLNS